MRAGIIAVLCLLAWPAWGQKAGTPGKFDHYVLALSWSPTYCAGRAGREDAEQCGAGKSHGFVVHGLWPQYRGNGYPVRCATEPAPVPDAAARLVDGIMPSRKLIEHQWKRHGTCDGGTAADYFAKTRDAFAAVTIPAEFAAIKGGMRTLAPERVEALFVDANPGLSPERMAVVCRGRYAAEVRLCLDKNLKFADCGAAVRDRCADVALFPSAR